MNDQIDGVLALINKNFGGLRAEYFRDELFDLFTKPSYWPELLGPRPCLLVGGRGMGKTTVLRCLSYQGQSRLTDEPVSKWDYIGLYWRFDTAVVRSFSGANLTEEQWIRIFGHYVNLVLTKLISDFLVWVDFSSNQYPESMRRGMQRAANALHLGPIDSAAGLSEKLEDSTIELEAFINNAASTALPSLSMHGRPMKLLIDSIQFHTDLRGKKIFFLLDEFENLADYQQRVVNTLIRHSGDTLYSFKVGMRETGHRERSTLNPEEQLIEPADYALIDIRRRFLQSDFEKFAAGVCNERLAKVTQQASADVRVLLPSLSDEGEATLLGVDERIAAFRKIIIGEQASVTEVEVFDGFGKLEQFLIGWWRDEAPDHSPLSNLRDAVRNPGKWANRLNNYQYAMLFAIRAKKPGISKYYSGWDTYVHLASGNIRYLLQLVANALSVHLDRSKTDSIQVVDNISQTVAAQRLSRSYLRELQGLSASGGSLMRLVLGLGRVFQILAADPQGHTPEVTQFRVRFTQDLADRADSELLLSAGVMHQALQRFEGNKMASSSGETFDYDYRIHPVFAPLFEYSYRSKRRMTISSSELSNLVSAPGRTIPLIVQRTGRGDLSTPIPEQLTLFEEFYDDAE